MGKVKRLFVCSSCRRPAGQWSGRCSACGEWGTVGEHPAGSGLRSIRGAGHGIQLATLAPDQEDRRTSTGLPGLDRVLGGGLVPGSAVLLAGAPGIGKSTLLLQLASSLSRAGHSCLIASGEEARSQVAARAHRLGLPGESLEFAPGRNLDEVVEAARARRPSVLVVDSIQTIRDPRSDSVPGGTAQVRMCADALIGVAKEQDTTLLLVGHVTKEGELAGPRTLEHAVDVVVTFEGDPRSGLRLLTGGKNRFGPEGEVAWLEMRPTGLVEADEGPRIGDGAGEAGCAVALALLGRRALAVEVQALVVRTEGPPRRHVAGLDPRRFHILAAVTERVCRCGLARSELYGAAAGGLHLEDPGTDLAVAAALASASAGRAPPPGTAFVGEVALTGAVRPVPGIDHRIAAAARAGIEAIVLPPLMGPDGVHPAELRLIEVAHVRDALRWLAPGTSRGRSSPGAA